MSSDHVLLPSGFHRFILSRNHLIEILMFNVNVAFSRLLMLIVLSIFRRP
jgi:hypothetical protein